MKFLKKKSTESVKTPVPATAQEIKDEWNRRWVEKVTQLTAEFGIPFHAADDLTEAQFEEYQTIYTIANEYASSK